MAAPILGIKIMGLPTPQTSPTLLRPGGPIQNHMYVVGAAFDPNHYSMEATPIQGREGVYSVKIRNNATGDMYTRIGYESLACNLKELENGKYLAPGGRELSANAVKRYRIVS